MVTKEKKQDNQVVEITPEVAAAIVRSNFTPKVFSGMGGANGVEAIAKIGKHDLATMIKTDQVPQGVRIEGGSALIE